MIQREFSINIVILLLLNFLVKPLYIFAIEAGVQNLVGPTEYGKYFILFDFVFLFVFINDAGIQNYNSRHVASNRENLGAYFGELLGFKLFTGLLFTLITLTSAWAFGYLYQEWLMLIIILGVFFLNSVFMLLRSSLSALGYYRWDSYISALDKIILLLGLGVLVWRGYNGADFEIIWFPIAQLIAAIIACFTAFYLLKKTAIKLNVSFSFDGFKKMLSVTLPYAMILLLAGAYNRADAVMLDQLLLDGDYQAGLYAAAYRLIDAGGMVGFLFASLLLPMFANMITKKEDYSNLFSMAYKYLFIIGLLIALTCGFYANDIYNILYSAEYQGTSSVLTILMWSFVPVSLTHCFGSFLIANGKLKAINTIFLIGLVTNLIGNYFLIPIYKAEGAAFMTVITQIFLLLGMVFYVGKNYYNLNILKLLSTSIGLIIISLILFWGLEFLPLFWLVKSVIGSLLILLFALLIKWINKEDLFLLKERKSDLIE